jgi:hypothetical protein
MVSKEQYEFALSVLEDYYSSPIDSDGNCGPGERRRDHAEKVMDEYERENKLGEWREEE